MKTEIVLYLEYSFGRRSVYKHVPKPKPFEVVEVRFPVEDVPKTLRVGDTLELSVFGNTKEDGFLPKVIRRSWSGQKLTLRCVAPHRLLLRLTKRSGARKTHTKDLGQREEHKYTLPSQSWK